jgi:hypothetical protein
VASRFPPRSRFCDLAAFSPVVPSSDGARALSDRVPVSLRSASLRLLGGVVSSLLFVPRVPSAGERSVVPPRVLGVSRALSDGVACGLRPAVACGFGDLPGEAVPIGDLVAAGGGVPAGEGAPAPGLVVAPALAPAPVAAPVVVVAAPVVVVEVPPETPTPTAAPWLTP